MRCQSVATRIVRDTHLSKVKTYLGDLHDDRVRVDGLLSALIVEKKKRAQGGVGRAPLRQIILRSTVRNWPGLKHFKQLTHEKNITS